jgi:hypothetical protein
MMKMSGSVRARQISGLIGVAILAVYANTALGQVRQVQMGGGMDANPQVGSGGANQPVQGYVPINGNDIMTGNVNGLKYFHGQVGRPGGGNGVGTFNQNEFNGQLGSSTLFNFARQSAGSNVTGGSVTGAQGQSFYLPSQVVSTSGGTMYSAPYGSGFDSVLVPGSAASPLLSGAQLGSLGALSLADAAQAAQYGTYNRGLPPAPRGTGEPGALLDSSLFATRDFELSSQNTNQFQNSNPLGQPNLQTTPRPGDTGTSTTQPDQSPGVVQGAVPGSINQQVVVNNRINGGLVDAKVSDRFKTLEDQLKQAMGTDQNTKGQDNGQTGVAAADIDPLTGLPRPKNTSGDTGNGRGGTGEVVAGGTGTGRSGRGASPQALTPKGLENLSDNQLTAGSKVKPISLGAESPGANGTTTFDVMMAKGEANLKAGKYMDAAAAYQAALAAKPQDPLALVGRAHGELGAGMYASAAYDLKFVFTRNPELISVKYDVNSFIPAARQQYLLDDLKKLAAKAETADLASFLYSYLSYQTGRDVELGQQLRQWGDREGHDLWQGVLNRAWRSGDPGKLP